MKWEGLAATRRAASAGSISSQSQISFRGLSSPSQAWTVGLRAEHANRMSGSARLSASLRIARIHASRSGSVNGIPSAILAMLAGEWNSSPSSTGHPARAARAFASVVLPHPHTPMQTISLPIPSPEADIDGHQDRDYHQAGQVEDRLGSEADATQVDRPVFSRTSC